MDLNADIETRLGKIFTIVERIEEDRQEEMDRAGESHPLRKTLSKSPRKTKVKPSAGCHESWRNDSPPPVSFIIGAIRIHPFDRADPINQGVVSDEMVGTSVVVTVRRVITSNGSTIAAGSFCPEIEDRRAVLC